MMLPHVTSGDCCVQGGIACAIVQTGATSTLCLARLKSMPTPGFLRFVPFLPMLASC